MRFEEAADPRTALAPHYYHPILHEGGDYAPGLDADIEAALLAIVLSAERLGGVPVWMGELGTQLDNPSAGPYLEALVGRLAALGWGWAYWSDDLGGGFSLREADGTMKPLGLAPLAHPYARRVPGPILEARMDFAVGRFEARFSWTHDAPLELWVGVPARACAGDLPIARVLAANGTGGEVPCAQAPEAPVGVLHCPADPAHVVFGAEYAVAVTRANTK